MARKPVRRAETLSASEAADYMNGETILVDGGALMGGYAPYTYKHDVELTS